MPPHLQGLVFQAVEANSGRTVALKKSRVSQRVKRTVLQYETRILQLLQGHPAIPQIYGYGHLPHFEYLAMELLGPSIKDRTTGPVAVTTTTRIVLQMLSALEHIHKCGFVHRDIKPENVLSSPIDPSKIVLIDFGISLRIKPGPPTRYDPLKESKYIVGTLHWASLNAHDGIGLGPRDDLESLAYIAFFLLRGDLPWRSSGSHDESTKNSMRRIRASKAAASGDTLGASFPAEFGYLLDYSRKLEYDKMPDYAELKRRFTDLNDQVGDKDAEGPLDWSSVGISVREEDTDPDITPSEDGVESDEEGDEGSEEEEESFSNSYFNWDIGDWDVQGARDRSLTLPIEQVELVDSSIPQIVEVTESE
ncbi:kinase-like domain-containing protein [Russula brevipes]|nr:kinase-like domain-containing protein [Russula brevipes]